MKQRCFKDFSMSIYRLQYKKLLLGMIEIRKPNVQQPLQREQGVMLEETRGNVSHKVRRQSISRKGKETKQFCPKENVY